MKIISQHPVILFDGVCNLCDASVRFVMRHDKKKRFYFASLQSDAAKKVLLHYTDKNNDLNSIVLIEENKILLKSDAVLEICKGLGFPWNVFNSFRILPKRLRDRIYDWVANNRYKWFGKNEYCEWIATKENRFIQ